MPILSLLCTAGIYVATNYFGVYHGYLYYELTRYNSVVDVTNNITTNFPNNSYTIISTTDELHQVVEYGRHEEMLNFLRKLNSSDYTLPTQYLFFYVEKKPIQYAQSHFFTGPDWLAAEKYSQYYQDAGEFCYAYFFEGITVIFGFDEQIDSGVKNVLLVSEFFRKLSK